MFYIEFIAYAVEQAIEEAVINKVDYTPIGFFDGEITALITTKNGSKFWATI